MNVFNPLVSMRRLAAAGLERRQAEAIADEINDGKSELVTKDYLKEQLEDSLDKQTIKLRGFAAALIALATTILGVLVSLK